MNTESSLFREISLEDIKNITYRHLGTREISQARLMEGGLFNTTYHQQTGHSPPRSGKPASAPRF